MLRQAILKFLWRHPHAYQVVQKLRSRGDVLDTNYDILFDGFPRSGNTFGAFMLLVSQQNRFKINTHRHTPPPFIRAAQINKPACLTLRPPLDAITSWIIYTKRSTPSVIRYYLNFYQMLLPHRSKFLILPFTVITQDFPLVIQLINLRFGLDLESQFDLEACQREVFERIDAKWKCEHGTIDKYRVARPSSIRDNRKPTVRQEVLRPCYSGLMQRCEDLYQTYESEFRANLNRSHGLTFQGKKAESCLGKFDPQSDPDDSLQGCYDA